MVPLNPEKPSLAKYSKDDVRLEKYYVLIIGEVVFEIHYSTRVRFDEEITDWHYVRNGASYSYSDSSPLPKEVALVRAYHQEYDVDKACEILAAIEATPAQRPPCINYSGEILKCAIAPTTPCATCPHYEAYA
jgi:hypothetical protein